MLRETRAGGVTVNDTLWHFAHEGLPFGGVGASGQGVYHGEHGFRTFSLDKPVFVQRRLAPSRLLHPPYGAAFERMLALLRGCGCDRRARVTTGALRSLAATLAVAALAGCAPSPPRDAGGDGVATTW